LVHYPDPRRRCRRFSLICAPKVCCPYRAISIRQGANSTLSGKQWIDKPRHRGGELFRVATQAHSLVHLAIGDRPDRGGSRRDDVMDESREIQTCVPTPSAVALLRAARVVASNADVGKVFDASIGARTCIVYACSFSRCGSQSDTAAPPAVQYPRTRAHRRRRRFRARSEWDRRRRHQRRMLAYSLPANRTARNLRPSYFIPSYLDLGCSVSRLTSKAMKSRVPAVQLPEDLQVRSPASRSAAGRYLSGPSAFQPSQVRARLSRAPCPQNGERRAPRSVENQ